MAALCSIVWSGDTSALTGPPSTVATAAVSGTAKTILQLKTGTAKARVVEWGFGFDAPPANAPRVELVETGTVFATVTSIGSGIRPFNDVNGVSQLVAGTAATGFNATAEGTITASRLLDYHYENGLYYSRQYPLGREPEIAPGSALRVRATPTAWAAVNMWAYVIVEE